MKKSIFLLLLFHCISTNIFSQDSTKDNKKILLEYGTSFLVQSLGNVKFNKVIEGDKLKFQVYEYLIMN